MSRAGFVHETTIAVTYADERRARIVARSIAQERDEIRGDRSRAFVERDGCDLVVRVEARDLTALRAGCNTWSSLVEVAERCVLPATDR